MRASRRLRGLLILTALTAAGTFAAANRSRVLGEIRCLTADAPRDVVWRVRTDRKVVALTLDDGPDSRYTPRVLELAKTKHVKLTFFLIGRCIQHNPDLVRRETAEGHAIGNHTWDHRTMTRKTEEQDMSEIDRCEQAIEDISGSRPHLFRPPRGLWNEDTFRAAIKEGYRVVLWSRTLNFHTTKTPQAMAERIIEEVQPGMIILAHDGSWPANRNKVMEALPLLIDGLRAKGYEFVTLPELLRMGEPIPNYRALAQAEQAEEDRRQHRGQTGRTGGS